MLTTDKAILRLSNFKTSKNYNVFKLSDNDIEMSVLSDSLRREALPYSGMSFATGLKTFVDQRKLTKIKDLDTYQRYLRPYYRQQLDETIALLNAKGRKIKRLED